MRFRRSMLACRVSCTASFAALRVVLRRCLGRKRLPSWSLAQELVRDVQLAVLRQLCAAPAELVRSLPPPRVDSTLAAQMSSTATTVAGVPAERMQPVRGAPRRTVYYIHGGGYNLGSTDTHRELLYRIALAAEAELWSVDYRLAPEHPFPAAVDDVEAAWHALRERGLEPARTLVIGDSAGGGLVCALLQRLSAAREPLPAGAVLLCPATNAADLGASAKANEPYDYLTHQFVDDWIAAYVGHASREEPLISPQLADPTGWPPVLVHGGGREVLIDQIDAFVEHLRSAGVQVDYERIEDQIHVWHLFARLLPAARESIARIGDWARKRIPDEPSIPSAS